MTTTYADVAEGERIDIDVEFVTRQAVPAGDTRVHRLLVADRSGREFEVLVAPDSESLVDLKTGGVHRITGLLGADPPSDEPVPFDCPDCGEALREGQAVDASKAVARAATELGLDEPFGVVDAETTVRREELGTGVDDWNPMDVDGHNEDVPDFVCPFCDRHVDRRELDRPERRVLNENMAMADASETVGLAAGGAKDVTNFRENAESGYTPQPEAVSEEGLFYDYHFETGERGATDALFAPRYAAAVSDHPLTGETERYLSVGLDSTLAVDDFERPRLDLVAVLDVSGSMNSVFDDYYYDGQGRRREAEADATTKLAAATQSLCALTERLRDDDRLGVVLYNHRAHVAKPLRDVGATDMDAIRRHVRNVAAGGGTNLADGFEAAVDMLVDGDTDAERRVVFMTDMMPNTGATDEGELTDRFADAASEGVHTTFVGMGLDANAALTEALSGIRGANHYFVHSAEEFERRLGEEFDYMVTPLVYDLTLDVDADGYEVTAVHGSPSAEADTGRLVHVGTLFPSAKEDGKARGGVVLVRLTRTEPDAELALTASWTERGGGEHTERLRVEMPDDPETFAHHGVRKAVALSRYARELRSWARDVHDRADRATGVDDWLIPDRRGRHERESVPLTVSADHAARFDELRDYLDAEREAVGDDSLRRELDLLDTLRRAAPNRSPEVTDRC